MNHLLNHWLSGNLPVTEYSTITVPSEIHEKVILDFENQRIDISADQWLLCMDPAVFGIWLSKEINITFPNEHSHFNIHFKDHSANNKTTADLKLVYLARIEEPEGCLLLLSLAKVSIHHVNYLKTRFLYYRHYHRPTHTFEKLKSFAAAYSYPRKVRLISFGLPPDNNIFPMDLVGEILPHNRYVFGLRHTNKSLSGIVQSGEMAVCEVPSRYKTIIYQLGNNHKNTVESLSPPLEVIRSELFKFPIPAWSNSYKELKITKTLNLGSHMLLWGKVLNEIKMSAPETNLFHVHFLHQLHQLKAGYSYPMVS
jgi:hypothetical protein